MKTYILYNRDSKKYIQLDNSISYFLGGFPHEVNNWYNAHFFTCSKKAEEYRKRMRKDCLIYEVSPQLTHYTA